MSNVPDYNEVSARYDAACAALAECIRDFKLIDEAEGGALNPDTWDEYVDAQAEILIHDIKNSH